MLCRSCAVSWPRRTKWAATTPLVDESFTASLFHQIHFGMDLGAQSLEVKHGSTWKVLVSLLKWFLQGTSRLTSQKRGWPKRTVLFSDSFTAHGRREKQALKNKKTCLSTMQYLCTKMMIVFTTIQIPLEKHPLECMKHKTCTANRGTSYKGQSIVRSLPLLANSTQSLTFFDPEAAGVENGKAQK